jgi:hypothetical protein
MTAAASHTIPVFPSEAFRVRDGVAEGEPISFLDELVMDDVYQLAQGARRLALAYCPDTGAQCLRVAAGSEIGTPGNALYLDCCLTLMGTDGTTLEALVMVEVEGDEAANVLLLPLAQLRPESDYRLVGADRDSAPARFGEVAFVSFARGTHITLASGEQVPIEDLKTGDRVLTRDSGPQQIRWIGEMTLRAVGDFAPVLIRAGALFNTRDLLLSPEHRLFIYQRRDEIGAGRAEVLVKVRHLIDGETVYQQPRACRPAGRDAAGPRGAPSPRLRGAGGHGPPPRHRSPVAPRLLGDLSPRRIGSGSAPDRHRVSGALPFASAGAMGAP